LADLEKDGLSVGGTIMVRKSLQSKVFGYTTIGLYVIFLGLPLLWILSIALKTPLDAFASPPLFIFKPTMQNFSAVLHDIHFMKSLWNSFIVACLTAFFSMVIAIPASFGLSRLKGRLKTNILAWLLLSRAAPGMIYVIPFFALYMKLNLLDTRFGLILINMVFTIPLVTWMMLSFFEDIPASVEEAALVDGATPVQMMFKIAVPLAKPGISASSILAFIFSWNEFLFALILTRREAVTAPVTIVNYMAYEGTEWGKVAVGGIFILLPVLIFAIAIRKYLVSGLTAGAVKE
jgi:multiple sugar transport system permease protein